MKIKYKQPTGNLGSKFYRKDKKLSHYALQCDYIEKYESKDLCTYKMRSDTPVMISKIPVISIRLYMSGNYNVVMLIGNWKIGKQFDNSKTFKQFDTVTEARKYITSLIKQLKKIEVTDDSN